MYLFKSIVMLGVLALFSLPAMAQPGPRGPRGPQPERLQEDLELSEEQMEALKPIFESTRQQMDALREQSQQARKEQRAAVQEIMEAQKAQLADILTEAQLAKMATLQANHRPGGQRGPAHGSTGRRGPERGAMNQELSQALKAYRTTHIEPVLREQRAQLEQHLAEADKATIATLRQKREKHRAPNGPRQGAAPSGAEQQSDRTQLKALVEKYDAEITALLAAVAPQAEQWQKDIQAIHEEHRPEVPKQARKRGGKRNGAVTPPHAPGEGGGMRKAQFLLMAPAN